MTDSKYNEVTEFFSKKYHQQFKISDHANENYKKGLCIPFYSDDYYFEINASFIQEQTDTDKEMSTPQRIADTLESSEITIEKGKKYRFKGLQDSARSNEQPRCGFFYCIEEI